MKTDNTVRRKLKVSDLIITVLLVLVIILAYPRIFKKDKFENIREEDGRISIAVMPFENQTGDTTLNWFRRGISSLVINVLGSSPELAVCDDHTMYEVTESANQVFTAGISPTKAQGIAKIAKAETYITGSYQGKGDTYWVLANLVDTETGDIISTHRVEGDLLSSGYLDIANSLCNEIKNHLEIKAIEENAGIDAIKAYTESAEAYRHYIEGLYMILAGDFDPAILELKKALEIDSTFTLASFFLAYSYNFKSPIDNINALYWIQKAYNTLEKLPIKYQYWLELWYAFYCSKSQADIYRNLRMLESSGIDSRLLWADIAVTYQGVLNEPEMAIKAYNKVMQLSQERGYYHKDIFFYTYFGAALHEAGMHDREKEILELCLDLVQNNISKRKCYYILSICALSNNDTTSANEYLAEYLNANKQLGHTQDHIEYWLGRLYHSAGMIQEAETHIRIACALNPHNDSYKINLARFLIEEDIDQDEGMEIARKMLEVNPNSGDIRSIIAMGYYKDGLYEEAYQLVKEAKEITPWYNNDFEQQLKEIEEALARQKGER